MQNFLQEILQTNITEKMRQCVMRYLDKEAVLIACRFRHLPTGNDVVVGNTHLTWTKFKDLDVSCVQVSYVSYTVTHVT